MLHIIVSARTRYAINALVGPTDTNVKLYLHKPELEEDLNLIGYNPNLDSLLSSTKKALCSFAETSKIMQDSLNFFADAVLSSGRSVFQLHLSLRYQMS